MEKESIKKAIQELRGLSKKRKFNQTFDLIVNLKGLDMKKPEQHVEVFAHLNHSKGKPVRVCVFAGPELRDEATKNVDTTVFIDDFEKYVKDKHLMKRLANSHDIFIAQATIMPKVAQTFGKVLGTRGKMPNPKMGCVVPPKAALKPLYDSLQHTVILKAKVQPVVKCSIGSESQPDEEIIDNIMNIYNALLHKLPGESNNIKSVLLKLTMSKPVKLDA